MKKIYSKICWIIAGMLASGGAYAQVSTYVFSQSTGTYTPITGGAVIATGTADDNTYSAQNIGFPFTYDGASYTQFGLNVNGWINLGGGAPTSSYTPISTGITNNIISGIGRDLQLGFTTQGDRSTGSNVIINVTNTAGFLVGDVLSTATGFPAGTTITSIGAGTITVSNNATSTGTSGTLTVGGEIRVETIGTTPNQVCVVQWSRARKFGTNGRNDIFNFQIRLNEADNSIDIIYALLNVNVNSTNVEVGLRGANNTDFNNRTTATDWNTTTAGAVNSANCVLSQTVFPAMSLNFHWALPPACSGTPVAGTASAPAAVCSGTNFNITLAGQTTDLGITYQWQSSPDGITFSNIGGATNAMYTGSQTDTTYYQCIVTCTNSGLSSTSNVVVVNLNPFYVCYCIPTYSTGTGFGDYISLVSLDTINNPTGPAASPYYTQYSTPTTTLYQGLSFNITLSAGTYTDNDVAAWIDYNHDGVFDNTTEKLGQTLGMGAMPASTTFNFTVPIGALTGVTALRIREADQGSLNMDPCVGYTYGETEDYLVNIQTPPPCTNPAAGGIVTGPSNDTIGNSGMYVVTGYNGNLQWYTSTNAGGPYTQIPGATNDTLNVNYNTADSVFFMVIANTTFCPADTSNVIGTYVLFPGDNVCESLPLIFGTNGPYNNTGATVQPGEPAPPATGCQVTNGWCNSTLNNTMWFTFVAPPSGRVIIHSPGFDTQLGVWDADTCADVLGGSAVLLAANDDDPNYTINGGAQFSSYLPVNCLTPGKTYYVQFDGYSTPGSSTIILTDPGFVDTTFTGLVAAYCDANVNDTAFAVTPGGVFTGGSISGNIFNPNVAGAGTHVITYTLMGCYSSSQTVNVYVTPVVNLGADINGCGPALLDAGNADPGNVYAWNTGDTTQTLNVYDTTGQFIVTVNSPGGCSDADTINVTSLAAPVVDLGADTIVCAFDYQLDAGNAGSDYLWSTSDITQTLFLSAPVTGTYSVTVTNTTTGCSDADTITLSVFPPVTANAGSDTTVCSGNSVQLDAGSGFTTYNWTDGQLSSTNQIVTVTPGVTTDYILTVTNSFGCADTDTVTISLDQVPNAAFSSSGSLGVYNFTNNSIPASGTSYQWNFGDGSPVDNSANPSHTFPSNGAYNVTLVVTNACGSDSTSQTVFVDGIGINELDSDKLSVYPNPTSGNLTIVNPFGSATVKVTNMAGEIVATEIVSATRNVVDYTALPNGIYMVELTSDQHVLHARLVIQK